MHSPLPVLYVDVRQLDPSAGDAGIIIPSRILLVSTTSIDADRVGWWCGPEDSGAYRTASNEDAYEPRIFWIRSVDPVGSRAISASRAKTRLYLETSSGRSM